MVVVGSWQRAEAPGQGIAQMMRQRPLVPGFQLFLDPNLPFPARALDFDLGLLRFGGHR